MATSILTDTIRDPGGNVVATSSGTTVNFRLMAGGSQVAGFRISDGVNVASQIVTSASTTGAISQALENNTNITPTGTYYIAEILNPSSQGGTQEWALLSSSSASPQSFRSALLSAIPSYSPPTTIPPTVLTGNNTFTGTNQFNGDVFFKDGRPWCDVMAFGAVGDGVTDDTAAFQAAINQAQTMKGSLVYLPTPPVRYLNNSGLTVDVTKSNLWMMGAGQYVSNVRYTGSGTWLSPTGSSSSNSAVQLEKFRVQLTGSTGAIGVDMRQFITSCLRDMTFSWVAAGNGGTGVQAIPQSTNQTSYFNQYDNCIFEALATGVLMDSTVAQQPNRSQWISPKFLSVVNGMTIGNVKGASIFGPYFDQQSGTGITLTSNADRISIYGAEQETAAGGTMFSINAAANQTKIFGVINHAGTIGLPDDNFGTRTMVFQDSGVVNYTNSAGVDIGLQFPTDAAGAFPTEGAEQDGHIVIEASTLGRIAFYAAGYRFRVTAGSTF